MKLTTATLKKLIREELNRMNEGVNFEDPDHKDIFMIIVNVGMSQGLPEAIAGAIAKQATVEIDRSGFSVSGYELNMKKGSSPMPQPSSEDEKIFMIIVNAAKEEGLEEAKAGMLAKAASAEIVKSKAGKVSGYAINTKKQR